MKKCKVCIGIFLEQGLESFDVLSMLARGETCVFYYGGFLKGMSVLTEL